MNKPHYRKRIQKTLDRAEEGDKVSRYFDLFIMTLIVLNVFAVITETVEDIYTKYKAYYNAFEYFSVVVFSIEYVIRVWNCTVHEKHQHPFWGRIKYILSMEAIIDLLAILPFYLPMIFPINALFLRILRLFRLLRIFKLGRYSTAFQMVVNAVKRRSEELVIVITIVIVLLILSSSMMYYIEHDAQPDVFTSIPATMWWGVATLTTVGYGDVYPITAMGKVLGAFLAILGIGVFALPAGIIATSFESELSKRKKQDDDEDSDED